MTTARRPLDLEDIMQMSLADLTARQQVQWRKKKGESSLMHAVCEAMRTMPATEYRAYLITVARRNGSTADA